MPGPPRNPLRLMITAAWLLLPLQAVAATRGYTITSFDAIRVDAPVEVIITTGAGASAKVDGDQSLIERLHIDVSGRLLTIRMDRARPGEKSGGRATVRLSTGTADVMCGGTGAGFAADAGATDGATRPSARNRLATT